VGEDEGSAKEEVKMAINREEIIESLHLLNTAGNAEVGHEDADEILCNVLIELGYSDIVRAYEEVEKWYS